MLKSGFGGVAARVLGALACGLVVVACGSSDDAGGVGSGDGSGGSRNGGGGSSGSSGGSGFGGSGAVGGAGGTSGTGGTVGSAGSAGGGNTNVSLGGAQDFGYFRRQLDDGIVPAVGSFDSAGFFAEHHSELPEPTCGEQICVQPMLGVMGNLTNGANCTMLQIGLNSPIVADPNNRPPLNLSVVVDVSGSMSGAGKLDYVKDGLELMIDGLRDGDKFALITYSDGVNVPFPMQPIELKRSDARSIVQGLSANGGTNLYGGLQEGYLESQEHYESDRQNRVILLSDGMPTAGITSPDSIASMSATYNSDGVGLTTIGLGTSFNVELMRDLALRADGNFYFVEDAGAVSEVFGQELSYFTVPIGFDLKLSMRTGSDYDFGRAYGSPLWQDTQTGGSVEIPSAFIAHRESDSDQTPDGGRRGGGSALLVEVMPKLSEDDGSGATKSEVAIVDLEFREPGTNRIVTDSVTVQYPLPPWETRREGWFDSTSTATVQKSFVMLNIYVGIENACTDFHDGNHAEVIGRLDRLIAAATDYNEEVADEDIAADIELLGKLRSVLIANGVPDPSAPIPEDPWPAD